MPIYSYKCTLCGREYDKMKSFEESDEVDECPYCHGEGKREMSEPSVVFKGSGFYCTDNTPCGKSECKENGSCKKSGE